MKSTQLDLLILIGEQGGLGSGASLTTTKAAQLLGVSQQTASRWFFELGKEGMLEKTALGIKLTPAAALKLERIKRLFDRKPSVVINGKVVEGMKDGSYYMSQDGYKKQFLKLLGFEPYPGTLNLKLDTPTDVAARVALEARDGMIVESFKVGERFFGGVKAYPVKINGRIDGAVIIPMRTHHNNTVLEVIAKERLRDKLHLKNDSNVVIETR